MSWSGSDLIDGLLSSFWRGILVTVLGFAFALWLQDSFDEIEWVDWLSIAVCAVSVIAGIWIEVWYHRKSVF